MDGVEETASSELAVGKQPEEKREGARYGQFGGENSRKLAVGKQPEGKRERARYGQFRGEN